METASYHSGQDGRQLGLQAVYGCPAESDNRPLKRSSKIHRKQANSLQSRYDENMTPQIRSVVVARYCETGGQGEVPPTILSGFVGKNETALNAVKRLMRFGRVARAR